MPGMTGLSGQLFDTVGLEVEGTQMNRDWMHGTVMQKLAALLGSNFHKVQLDRDASTESIAEMMRLGGKFRTINTHSPVFARLSNRGSGENQVQGYEFKTVPLEMKDVEPILYPLMWTLYEHGDIISDRASIHIHVGFANNFRMLKSLLTMMLTLEPVLYRLGGMGGTFRGHLNHAAYCRPLLNSCVVPVLRMSGTKMHAQIINPQGARDATSLEQFWAYMGVENPSGGQHKYHPSRYVGGNFFSLFSHGTFEWRYFNKCFDVPLVVSLVKFMRAFVETSSLVTKRELSRFELVPSNEEISDGDAEGILSMTHALFHEKGVDHIPSDGEMAHILEVLQASHFVPLPETPTLTHIRDFAITESLVEKGKLRTVTEYLPSNYVDIHTIAEQMVSIYA